MAAATMSRTAMEAQDSYDEKSSAKGPHLKIDKNYELDQRSN